MYIAVSLRPGQVVQSGWTRAFAHSKMLGAGSVNLEMGMRNSAWSALGMHTCNTPLLQLLISSARRTHNIIKKNAIEDSKYMLELHHVHIEDPSS